MDARHVAIIPDGNRRWAKEKGLIATAGHAKSASFEHAMSLFKTGKSLGIKYFSIWGFSTENWKRSQSEIKEIFKIMKESLKKYSEEFKKEKIKFLHIGRKDRIPLDLMEQIKSLEEETSAFSDFVVAVFLDYGGRDEIIRATNKLLTSGKKEITEKDFASVLDSSTFPDPDLIIRTGKEKRTSGFMPFQSDYSELYFTDAYFPDFGPEHLKAALEEFSNRKRRFGE